MSFLASALESLITFFHFYLNNWGWAILGLAIVMRILLFPVQAFNFKQQRLMAKVQPEFDVLSAKHKEDPMRLFKEMGEVKKRNGVKSGLMFLSSLVQIPLFMSIYRMFSNLQMLVGGHFVWLVTLGASDPWFIFPTIVALTAYAQQRMTPLPGAKMNPQMVSMMKFMPVLSLVFMVAMPSGLVLYYAACGLLQLGGDLILRRWG